VSRSRPGMPGMLRREARASCRARGSRYLLLDSELEALTKPLELAGVTVIRCPGTGGAEDSYEQFLAAAPPSWPVARGLQELRAEPGPQAPALLVDDLGLLTRASWHHGACRVPAWNDSLLITTSRARLVTWRTVVVLLCLAAVTQTMLVAVKLMTDLT
jgi:hypothetical protein